MLDIVILIKKYQNACAYLEIIQFSWCLYTISVEKNPVFEYYTNVFFNYGSVYF